MEIEIQERKIKFSKRDYESWLQCDPSIMPDKLIISTKKDIKEGRKTQPPLHHLPANVAKIYFEAKGYIALLSEMSGNEYKLFRDDSRIEKKVGEESYQLFLRVYRLLRNNRVIKQAGGEPDLFVYNEDEFFFVEAKRIGPPNMVDDRLRENQKIIISLIKMLLNVDTEVYAVVFEDLFAQYIPKNYIWNMTLEVD